MYINYIFNNKTNDKCLVKFFIFFKYISLSLSIHFAINYLNTVGL